MSSKRETPFHKLDKLLVWLVPAIAIAMVLFHVVIVWYPMFGEIMTQNAHLGFCLVLIPLHWARTSIKTWDKTLCWLAAICSLAIAIYLAIHYERLDMEAGFPEPTDVVVGITLISIVIWATWRSFGPVFPILVFIAIGYAFLGEFVPGVMGHPPFEFGFIISSLSVGFQGIFGMLMSVSVNTLFLLVIFGSIFEATGITAFFMEFGKLLGRYLPGGSGHMAIFSSSFVGMVNGAAGANVAITGSYTIPVMKKAGFRSETAGGIEAMASTGGQLTPPIMGIAVFVMAGFLGTSYADLMFKAIIPAGAYYLVAVVGVIMIAFREKIPMKKEYVDKVYLLKGAPLFLIPVGVLTAIMLNHYSAGYAAFWSILTLLVVSYVRPATRPKIKVLFRNLVNGAIMAGIFGISIGCIGMLIKCLTFTGAATKLSLVVGIVSGGNLLLLLILVMLLSILLSSSTPTVIAYIIVAFVAAPVLVERGIPIVTAHFFVFYYAILAAVTPPVAGAAMVGCQIAGAKYLKTSWESFKLVGPFYFLPFFTINNPIILSEAQPAGEALMALIALFISLMALICFFQGFCFSVVNRVERVLFLFVGLLSVGYGLYGDLPFFVLSSVMMVVLLSMQWQKKRRGGIQSSYAVSTGLKADLNTGSTCDS